MRWVPVGLVGAGAAWIGWVSGPLFENWRDTGGYNLNVWGPLGWMAILFYAPFFLTLVSGTVLAFRALWLSTRRAELAAHLALGRTRRSLVSAHVREGARDGLVAGLGGVAIGASLRQIMTGFVDVEFVSNALWDYLAVVTLAVVSFTLAYWIGATWATRGSVRTVASGRPADAPAAELSHPTGRSRRRVLTWVAVVVVAALALIALPTLLSADETSSGFETVVAMGAGILAMGVLYLAVPGLLVWGGTRVAVRMAKAVGQGLARHSGPGSSRALAADALSRPTPARAVAVAVIITVMGVSVTVTAVYFGNAESNLAARDLAPHASVGTVELVPNNPLSASTQSGWAEPLPDDVLGALKADTALTVIEAGLLITDARDLPLQDGEAAHMFDRDLLIAVQPDALDEVSETGANLLYLTESVAWPNGQWGWHAPFFDEDRYVEVDGVRRGTAAANVASPWVGISRDWADHVWGASPTSAVLLYPAGDVSVADALAAHQLGDLDVAFRDEGIEFGGPASAGVVASGTGPFLALAVTVVIALAWSSQRLRAKDQATLLALGATSRALRGAAALESALLTTVAAAVGVLGGAISGPVLEETFSAPLDTVGAGPVLWNVGHTLTVMPWGVLVGLVLGAAAIAAAGAALIRVRLDRLSPAQQLTEAQKAGSS